MIEWERISLRRGVFWLAVYVVLAVAGLGLFFASGLYNVAASDKHLTISESIIKFVLERSVKAHSDAVSVPDLSNNELVALGARHYASGCLPCHGSPSQSRNPIASGMYPAPPPLGGVGEEWQTEELFWIVRHGLKFTGMPAWAGDGRDDEVWPVIAFLERMPDIDDEQFARLVGDALPQHSRGRSLTFGGAGEATVAFCDSCHGGSGASPVSAWVPPLAGQHEEYLDRALAEYRSNQRQSGIMEPIASALGDDIAERLVSYYADRPAASPRSPNDQDELAVPGRDIVERGMVNQQVPACMDCHSGSRSPQFPKIAGMPAAYVETQLRLFRSGVRSGTTFARIMSVVAGRLDDKQIKEIAAYVETMPAAAPSAGVAATESDP
jgi:cytochrome c553